MGPFGSRIKKENFVSEGVPVIKGQNLNGDFLLEDSFDFLTEEKADELKSSNAFRGDLVITHRGTIGQVGLIPRNSKYLRYVVSQSQLKVSLNQDLVFPEFVYYFFKTRVGQYRLLMNSSQVGVPAIARASTSIKSIEIRLPSLPEQKAIAHILGTLDDKIELNRKINQTLEAMAQALFKSWFVDFDPVLDKALAAGNKIPEALQKKAEKRTIVPSQKKLLHKNPELANKFPNSFEYNEKLGKWIPEGWEVKKLEDLATIKYGKDHKKLDDGDIPCFGSGGIMRYVNSSIYEEEAVLIPRKGTLSNIIHIDEPFWSVDTMFYSIMHDENLAKYFFYTIKSLKLEEMNEGSAVPSMTTAQLNALNILYPDSIILKKFDEIVNDFYRKKKMTTSGNKTLVNLRDTLLPKLISGEVRVLKSMCEYLGNEKLNLKETKA